MTTIKIVDAVHPRETLTATGSQDVTTTAVDNTIYTRRLDRSETTDSRDGIYNIRSRSAAPSIEKQRKRVLTIEDGDPGLRKEGDFKRKQVSCFL